MQNNDLINFILDGVSKSRSRDEIIFGICQGTGITWEAADALVERVIAENDNVIARRRFPLLIIVAFFFFITGLLLVSYGIYGISLFFTRQGGLPADLTTYFMPIIESGLDPLQVIQAAVPAYFRLILYFLFSPFSAILFGIAMIFGSLVGMRDVWSAILH
jgi:D-alanyl-lipoteichoic acid acyltransferase DltB (MBOAT superfamily)